MDQKKPGNDRAMSGDHQVIPGINRAMIGHQISGTKAA